MIIWGRKIGILDVISFIADLIKVLFYGSLALSPVIMASLAFWSDSDDVKAPVLIGSIIGVPICIIALVTLAGKINKDSNPIVSIYPIIPCVLLVFFGFANYHAHKLPHILTKNERDQLESQAKMETRCSDNWDGACQDYYYGLQDYGQGSSGSSGPSTHSVRGYTRSNGTHVDGYTRSNPDGITSNNIRK